MGESTRVRHSCDPVTSRPVADFRLGMRSQHPLVWKPSLLFLLAAPDGSLAFHQGGGDTPVLQDAVQSGDVPGEDPAIQFSFPSALLIACNISCPMRPGTGPANG